MTKKDDARSEARTLPEPAVEVTSGAAVPTGKSKLQLMLEEQESRLRERKRLIRKIRLREAMRDGLLFNGDYCDEESEE